MNKWEVDEHEQWSETPTGWLWPIAVTFSIAGRIYKMADPCILLWFIYLFLLKKRNRRKYHMKSTLF